MQHLTCFFLVIFLLVVPGASPAQGQIKPGQTFRDCANCPEMIVIPAGSFIMGAGLHEHGSFPEDGPQRKVTVRQFAIGKFDITRGQWAAFVAATNRPTQGGCSWSGLPADSNAKPWALNPAASWNHLGFEQDDSHPVVCISWTDTHDYIAWLNKIAGGGYRLLSEAEWEYAARSGSTTAYPWGDTPDHEHANYGADSGFKGIATGHDRWVYTSPAGSFPPNAFGLYDMHGNVLQYLEDCFSLYSAGVPADGTANTSAVTLKMTGPLSYMDGKNACSFRIVRGGDYGDPPAMIRSAFRNWAPGPGATLETYRSAGLGFRIGKTL